MESNNLTLNINLNNLKENERDQLMALVEKANKPKSKVWKPSTNERYYYIHSDGRVYGCTYDADSYDDSLYNFGNCYKTKEAAKFATEARKIYVALQRYAEEHNNKEIDKYNPNVAKWLIGYDCDTNKVIAMATWSCLGIGEIYFSSDEIATAAVHEIGEDRIKKYLFGVDNHDC